MLALIDGDIVAHRVAWTTENDDFGIARYRADEMLDGILLDTGATEFTIWLSDRAENNFRYQIYPEYKANRKTLPRPRHLEALKEYLVIRWSARIAIGQEADDALGIAQIKDAEEWLKNPTVICTIDKDLQQIPGTHYNFVKKEHAFVTPEEGLRTFYRQILVGDTSDNIGGCPGIGPVKADKLLRGVVKESELARQVFKAFVLHTGAISEESRKELRSYIEKIGQVLKIRQQEEEPIWHFPLENLMEEFPLQSTQPKQGVSGPSTVHTDQNLESGSQSVGEKVDTGTPKAQQP